jgi:hypothetical protein
MKYDYSVQEEWLKEEKERQERDAKEQMAKKPRHEDLVIVTLLEGEAEESSTLSAALKEITPEPKRASDPDAFVYDGDNKAEKRALEELRSKMQTLKIVARAKVTQSRIYSAAYHPEASKDLIFFGGKDLLKAVKILVDKYFQRQAWATRNMGRTRAAR